MCTLIVLRDVVPELPVVLAANRDEFFARPSSPAMILDAEHGIVGGRDDVAGGTWKGLTRSGFFAALTNQRQGRPADRSLASRGQVVMEALRAGARGGVAEARVYVEGLDPAAYNPFNLMFGDASEVFVVYARPDGLRVESVPPGVHVLPNDTLDSPAFPKVERIREALADVPRTWSELEPRLRSVLADDRPPATLPVEPRSLFPKPVRAALHAVAVKLPSYGTRSSSLAALAPGSVVHYAFADGPPGTPYVDHTSLLRP